MKLRKRKEKMSSINNLNTKSKKPPLIISNALVIGEEVEQVAFDGGSILHLILWEKNIRWRDTGL